jgi:hypothetical protein
MTLLDGRGPAGRFRPSYHPSTGEVEVLKGEDPTRYRKRGSGRRPEEPTSVGSSSARASDCQYQGAVVAGLALRAVISKIAIPLMVVATTVVAFKSRLSSELSITKNSGLGSTSFATQTHCLS